MMVLLLALVHGSCGGGGSIMQVQTEPVNSGWLSEQMEILPGPADVAPDLWADLQTELKRVLAETGAEHAPSTAPTGEYNRVADLQVSTNPDGTATFTWHYRNTGDYNQDKAVTANDLTPVGQQFEQNTTDGVNDPQQQVVDGNSDGWVTIHDITAIGQNFNKQVDGYLLEAAVAETAASWKLSGTVGFAAGVLPEDRGWRGFTLDLAAPVDGMYYRIAPYHDTPDQRGLASTAVRFDISAAGRPQNVTATQGTLAGKVHIAWSEMPAALNYGVWSAAASDGLYTELGLTAMGETTFLDATAAPGIGNWYIVRGNLLGGWSEPSEAAWGHAMAPPTTPMSLTATDGDHTDRIQLEWEPATGADGYLILRSTTSGAGYSQVGASGLAQYADTDAVPGAVYYYVVEALNAAGTSPPSNEAAGRIAIAGTAPQVESVSPLTGEGGTSVQFSAIISGGTPDSYNWNFGGGGIPNLTAATEPTVWLALPDQYDCRLIVANSFGVDVFNFVLTITDPQLAPLITGVTPLGGDSTGVYTFTATVNGGTPDEWEWNFGGGANPNTSPVATPQVELGAEGNYSAWVRAANDVGADTFPFTLAVGDAPPPAL